MLFKRLQRIELRLDQLWAQGGKIVAELQDLQAAVAGIATEISAGVTAIDAAVAKLAVAGVAPADVEAQAVAIQTATASLKTAVDALGVALNPPPKP